QSVILGERLPELVSLVIVPFKVAFRVFVHPIECATIGVIAHRRRAGSIAPSMISLIQNRLFFRTTSREMQYRIVASFAHAIDPLFGATGEIGLQTIKRRCSLRIVRRRL